MATISATAAGSGYYRVFVDGAKVSQHLVEREAIERAANESLANASVEVYYDHDYRVAVTTTAPVVPPVDPPVIPDPPVAPPVDPPQLNDLANIDTLRNAGWPIPDPAEWHFNHPSPAEIKSSLVAPHRNDAHGICVKRLWLPHMLSVGEFDAGEMAMMAKYPTHMQRQAMAAWHALDVGGDVDKFAQHMQAASAAFHSQCDAKLATGTVIPSAIYASFGTREELAALLALDWIDWTDAAEFEQAFAKVRELIERNIAHQEKWDRNFRRAVRSTGSVAPAEGYWNATHWLNSAYYLESFLALSVHGVNPDGPSHTWADSVIDRIGLDPDQLDPQPVWSPWEAANALNLLSLGNGGGREWGANDKHTSLGGYELAFGFGAMFNLRALDTATGGRWQMVDRNLYLQSRWIGLCAIEDAPVERTGFHADGGAAINIYARLLGDSEAGQRYAWVHARNPDTPGGAQFREFKALAGPMPTASAPTGTFADRVGSRWYYQEDRSKPDSTFRCMIHHRSLDTHRETGDERVLRFAVGNIGLVEGHANRSNPNGALSNGIWFGRKATSGDPIIAHPQWWSHPMTRNVYGTERRAYRAEQFAQDPVYLFGDQPKPVHLAGRYSWTQDWSDWAGIYNGKGTARDPRLSRAISRFELDSVARKLTIEDTISIDLSDGLYLGWHFSPNVMPTMVDENTFELTDGINTIRVTLEPLGDFGWKRTVRTGDAAWNLDTYTLQQEWHNSTNGGAISRIAANVGYEPDRVTADGEYRVRVTITAE